MATATQGQAAADVDPYLMRFIRTAQCGKHRGASSGEKAAYQLAKCLTDHAATLDGQLVVGLKRFVDAAADKPWACQELFG